MHHYVVWSWTLIGAPQSIMPTWQHHAMPPRARTNEYEILPTGHAPYRTIHALTPLPLPHSPTDTPPSRTPSTTRLDRLSGRHSDRNRTLYYTDPRLALERVETLPAVSPVDRHYRHRHRLHRHHYRRHGQW